MRPNSLRPNPEPAALPCCSPQAHLCVIAAANRRAPAALLCQLFITVLLRSGGRCLSALLPPLRLLLLRRRLGVLPPATGVQVRKVAVAAHTGHAKGGGGQVTPAAAVLDGCSPLCQSPAVTRHKRQRAAAAQWATPQQAAAQGRGADRRHLHCRRCHRRKRQRAGIICIGACRHEAHSMRR